MVVPHPDTRCYATPVGYGDGDVEGMDECHCYICLRVDDLLGIGVRDVCVGLPLAVELRVDGVVVPQVGLGCTCFLNGQCVYRGGFEDACVPIAG